jgi:hypothetical protein
LVKKPDNINRNATTASSHKKTPPQEGKLPAVASFKGYITGPVLISPGGED